MQSLFENACHKYLTSIKQYIQRSLNIICTFICPTPLTSYLNQSKMLTQELPRLEIFRDVTDNKTADTSPPISYKSLEMPLSSTLLNAETERIKTFEGRWPLSWMDMNLLAQTGMYYTGTDDTVKCNFCGVEIGRWEETDHPVTEHMRWSPNCPLMRRRPTANIPLDEVVLDRILPPATYDVCGGTEVLDIRPQAYPEDSIMQPIRFPDHPEYAIETARLRSFAEWPRTMKQKPEQLADAGFFYTGIGDRVKCFSCGGGLKDWDESDDPWEQHALWLGNCHFLKLNKTQKYIDSVIAKFKSSKESETKNEGSNTSNTSGVSSDEEHSSQELEAAKDDELNSIESERKGGSFELHDKCRHSHKKKAIPDEKVCKICYVNEYNTAFLPCGHVVACVKCASSVTKCPMCRQPFSNVMRVYFS
ncbi:death-associated inhibitor of apoptosis 1-like isoform X2 [Hermetia illucens]|uniref:death-associated inhibitor of apoptosis 1-like isoform X2 n=1 Tax=Hermetia illucens TaxID=343691 RepID=UPI0018CC334B|nr:death-associated inhibitor of apoptosis 1-like isoform X2 [Hermetia illucens]